MDEILKVLRQSYGRIYAEYLRRFSL